MAWKYRDPELLADGRINVMVQYLKPHPLSSLGWMPTTVGPTDVDPNADTVAIFELVRRDPKLKPYIPPTQQELYAKAVKEVLRERDRLLRRSDWTQLLDTPEPVQKVWAEYRQKLREIEKSFGYPHNTKWPVAPGG